MAVPNSGPRGLNLDQATVWANRDGVFLGSTDPDCTMIVPLKGAAKDAALAALAAHGRPVR